VGEPKLPVAMMTIPDFCWQPAMVVRSADPAATPSSSREKTPGHESLGDLPQPPASAPDTKREEDRTAPAEITRRERVRWPAVDVARLKAGLQRQWLPVGGIAVALLWVASVLLSGGNTPDGQLAPKGPRQARRDPAPRLNPLAEGQLRTTPRAKRESTSPLKAEVTPDSPTEIAAEQHLFDNVRIRSGLPRDELTGPEVPTAPILNPPARTPATIETAPEPAAAVDQDRPGWQRADSSRPGSLEQTAPAETASVADGTSRPGLTEYEWGTPTDTAPQRAPEQEAVGVAHDAGAPNSQVASGDRNVSSGQPSYRETNPASYKDPLYVIPPLARQPKAPQHR
jgi:hypothetical protein